MARALSIEERVARWKLFYRRANERPLLGFFVGSEYPLLRYPAAATLPRDRPLAPDDFPVAAYAADSQKLFELHEACGGDCIWSASAFWGIPWLEAALGCPIFADRDSGSAYSKPPPGFAGPDSLPRFDRTSPWIVKLAAFIDGLSAASAGAWPIGTTRMRGIADLLAALYGSPAFIFAMMDKPDEVKEVCWRLVEFWIEFGRLQLASIPPFHGGVGSFYYNAWAPAGTIWHQEDAAALLSPGLLDEFILPCDEAIVDAFDSAIMHLHPVGHCPVKTYAAMGFSAIELHVDVGGPNARDLAPLHRAIMELAPLIVWGRLADDDLAWLFEKLDPPGLAVIAAVKDRAEAEELWERHGNKVKPL